MTEIDEVRNGSTRRSAQTEAAYLKRFNQLKRAAANGRSQLDFAYFIRWLLAKCDNYRASSWRQVRAAVLFGLARQRAMKPSAACAIDAAIRRLKSVTPAQAKKPPRTSHSKAKRLPERERLLICREALALRSRNGAWLAAYLLAGTLTGLRPSEWPDAQFRPSQTEGFAWELIVKCGKNTNGRAHGPSRTLRWVALPRGVVEAIDGWLARARGAARAGRYKTIMGTLGAAMARITKKLFPRRRKRPTLYSTRHEAAARWKAAYVNGAETIEQRLHGLAVVAALLGHASDATATRHYGRPSRGSKAMDQLPLAVADPAEIVRIRQHLKLDRLAGLAASRRSPAGP
jgi:integrase